MTLVVGIDGGGTRTRALILDEEGVDRGRGEGPPGIVGRGDSRQAAEAVEEAVSRAARDAGVALPVAHLCAGLAGAGSDDARGAARIALQRPSLARDVTVTTDVEVAFHDAFPEEGPGILLVCGTGSVAVGRGPDGGMVRAGGWGALLDDAGSGYWIGLEALRAVLRSFDGRGSATRLTGFARSELEVTGPGSLAALAEGATKARIAALAPRILEIAEGGDETAHRILERGVRELVALVRAVSDRVSSDDAGDPAPPVVLHGGLVAPGRPLRAPVRGSLEAAHVRVLERVVDPARGAARMALAATLDSRP